MDVKADHRAARALIDRNFFDVQRVDGKDIAMGLAFWRSRAAVSGLAKIGTFMGLVIVVLGMVEETRIALIAGLVWLGLLTAVWFTRVRKNAVLTVTES